MNYKDQTTNSQLKLIDQISAILQRFIEQGKQGVYSQYAKIGNLDFKDLFSLYKCMVNQDLNVALFMPGEIGNECITILYEPIIGCTIEIESTPAVNMSWKIKQLDLKTLIN